ncbi:MAG: alkaline phosphatase, partial [Chitinophagia bacterium]|nr:alkaline phosphatase [Chitinophagia bacterium]
MYKLPVCLLIAFTAVCFAASAQLPPLPPRPAVAAALAPFYHGVASGDPLSDRVIIWTRYTPTSPVAASIDWQIATDSLFTSVVRSGTVATDSNVDYTVKVDVTGLTANTWYYYRFKSGTIKSITGRTHTLPVGDIDSIRLAFVSCSDFQTGFFNVYNALSKRNDISAVVHLGDFYYEYKAGGSGAGTDTSRYHPATHDASTLADYRLWNSQYKLDPDLRNMLQQYPLIMVWDDHEVCNNAWFNNAENHNSSTQGNYFTRKKVARKAYFEWNPIRETAPGNDSVVHRNFIFGKLFNLLMLDTRLEGRDSSLGALIPATNAYMNDTNRTLLGASQLTWF